MTEFSDRPFVAGSLFGLRAFSVDQLGRLTGVTFPDVWTPGENQAQCHRDKAFAMGGGYFFTPPMMSSVQALQALSRQMAYGGVIVRGGGRLGAYPPGVPSPAGDDDESRDSTAAQSGMARPPAYLNTKSAGTPSTGKRRKGKRDQKPYVVSDKPTRLPGASLAEEAVTSPAPKPEPRKPEHDMVSLGCGCGFYAYFDGSNDYLSNATQAVTGVVEGYGKVVVGSRGFRCSKVALRALVIAGASQAARSMLLDKIQRNYPLVPVFATEAEAIRAFPLTDPDPISPDTTGDFWTRSAS